jgi:riboflavin synthase alpha subunit
VSPDSQADQDPFLYSGDFQVTHPGGTVTVDGCSLTVSFTGSGTIEVRARYNGRTSAAKSLTVGAADGEFIS